MSRVRMTLFLLTAQALIFVLYTLALFTSALADRSRVELATLSGRGASTWQIVRVFALENLMLALPAALVLGPALARVVNFGWDKITGQGQVLTGALPSEAWLLSGGAAGFGWLALILPLFLSARRSTPGGQPERAQPPQLSMVQKRYLDLYLLAFGALLYWQLNLSGSFVMRRLGKTELADPLLLIGPSLLLIAAAMLSLRALPFLLRWATRFFQRLRGLALPLALFRLARDPLQPGRVVLLISLNAGLMLFTRTFGDSLAQSQQALRSDALARGVSLALQLNAWMLLFFSVTAFFLSHFFAARQRARQFGILHALGVPARQWLMLLVVESLPVLLLGLAAGVAVGIGLSHIMIPYLSQALGQSLGGAAIERIVFDWPGIARLYGLLTAVYGSALALLVWILSHTGVHRFPGTGDE